MSGRKHRPKQNRKPPAPAPLPTPAGPQTQSGPNLSWTGILEAVNTPPAPDFFSPDHDPHAAGENVIEILGGINAPGAPIIPSIPQLSATGTNTLLSEPPTKTVGFSPPATRPLALDPDQKKKIDALFAPPKTTQPATKAKDRKKQAAQADQTPISQKIHLNEVYEQGFILILGLQKREAKGNLLLLASDLAATLEEINFWEFGSLMALIELGSKLRGKEKIILHLAKHPVLIDKPQSVFEFASIPEVDEPFLDILTTEIIDKKATHVIEPISIMCSVGNPQLHPAEIIDFALQVSFPQPIHYKTFAMTFPGPSKLRPFPEVLQIAKCAETWDRWQDAVFSFADLSIGWDIGSVTTLMPQVLTLNLPWKFGEIIPLITAAPAKLKNKPADVVTFLSLKWQIKPLIQLVSHFESAAHAKIDVWAPLATFNPFINQPRIFLYIPPAFDSWSLGKVAPIIPKLHKQEYAQIVIDMWSSGRPGVFLNLLNKWGNNDMTDMLKMMCSSSAKSCMLGVFTMVWVQNIEIGNLKNALIAKGGIPPDWNQVVIHFNPFPLTAITTFPFLADLICYTPVAGFKIMVVADQLNHIALGHTFQFIDYDTAMRNDDGEGWTDGGPISFLQPWLDFISTLRSWLVSTEFEDDLKKTILSHKKHVFIGSTLKIVYKTTGSNTAYITTAYPLNGINIPGNVVRAIGMLKGALK